MEFICEGDFIRVYKLDDKRVLKEFKDQININNLKKIRLVVERNLGDYLPKIYCFTDKGTIEQYCGKPIDNSQLNLKNRVDFLVFLVTAFLKNQQVDPRPENFRLWEGKLKYIDWYKHYEKYPLYELMNLIYSCFDVLGLNLIKFLEYSSNFRKIQKYYRNTILSSLISRNID